MSAPSRLLLSLAGLLTAPWPAAAHQGVANDPSSQLLHVVGHPDHVAGLIGLGVLVMGPTTVALHRRARLRRPAGTSPRGAS